MNFKKTFISGSILVITASLIGGAINYLYHLVCLKLLNIKDYGTFESLISLSYLTGVLISSFSLTTVYFISHSQPNEIKPTINKIRQLTLKFALLTGLVLIIIFPALYRFFNINISIWLYLIFVIQIFASFFASNYQATLQGLLKFMELSISSLILSFGKIIFTTIFVIIGFKTLGAIGGLTLGLIFQIVFCEFALKKFHNPTKTINLKININSKFFKFLIFSGIINFFLISLFSTDLLLVKKFFPDQQVGIYSAASVLGRIIFFASSLINIVVFPLFIKNKNKQIFFYSLLYILIVSLLVNIIFRVFPQHILLPLTGLNYSEVMKIIPNFSIFFTLYSFYHLLSQFLLSQKNKALLFPVIITSLLQIVLIISNHPDLETIINQSIYSLIPGIVITSMLVFIKLTPNSVASAVSSHL